MAYVISLVALTFAVILGWGAMPSNVSTAIVWIASIVGVIVLGTTIFRGTNGKTEWNRVTVIIVLCIFNILFWSGFEQAGTTFNVFARDNTQRMIGSWEIPA